jgi:type IV secretory pathway TrbL component
LIKRFGVGETNSAGPPDTNSEPFRILDYARTAAQLEATAKQLTELLDRFDQTIASTNLTQLSTQAQSGGKQLVDYAFWKAVLFVVVVLLAFLIYRFVSARLLSAARSKTNSL